jgi:hypothetical protein
MGLLHAYTNTQHGMALPKGGMVAAAEVSAWEGPRGYVFVTSDPYSIEVIPGLEEDRDNNRVMTMYVPGPSFRTNHIVVDLTPDDSVAEVWMVGPTAASFERITTAPCGGQPGSERYTAAELSEGHCLILDGFEGRLLDNAGAVLVEDPALSEGEIRLAPGGRWAVPVTGQRWRWRADELSGGLPVVTADGSVAYELKGYANLPGADFTAEGDTMFVVGSKRQVGEPTPSWSLDILDASTSDLLAEVEFATALRLIAVLVDPVRPYVYVGGVGPGGWGGDATIFLAIVERKDWSVVAVVPAAWTFGTGAGSLSFGGSSGRVHLLSYCGWDCGAMTEYVFDTK